MRCCTRIRLTAATSLALSVISVSSSPGSGWRRGDIVTGRGLRSSIVTGRGFARPPSFSSSSSSSSSQSFPPPSQTPGDWVPGESYAGVTFEKRSPQHQQVLETGPPLGDLYQLALDQRLRQRDYKQEPLEIITVESFPSHQVAPITRAPVQLPGGAPISPISQNRFPKDGFLPNGRWYGEKERGLAAAVVASDNQRKKVNPIVVLDHFSTSEHQQGQFSPNGQWFGEKERDLLQPEVPRRKRGPTRPLDFVSESLDNSDFSPNNDWVATRQQRLQGKRQINQNVESEPEVITIDNVHQYVSNNSHNRGKTFTVNVAAGYAARGANSGQKSAGDGRQGRYQGFSSYVIT